MAQLLWMIALTSLENLAGAEAQDVAVGDGGGGTVLLPASVSVLLLHAIIVIIIIAIAIIYLKRAFIFLLFLNRLINRLLPNLTAVQLIKPFAIA